ncbi:MAG: hypothetical protein RSB70_00435 [Clostridium sp.]
MCNNCGNGSTFGNGDEFLWIFVIIIIFAFLGFGGALGFRG